MATRRELPPDVAATFDRVPKAGDRFFALPTDQQAAWLQWLDRAREMGQLQAAHGLDTHRKAELGITGLALQFVFVRRGRAFRRPARDEYEIESAWLPYRYWREQ